MDLLRRTSIVMQNYNRFLWTGFSVFILRYKETGVNLTQDYEFKKYICYITYLQVV